MREGRSSNGRGVEWRAGGGSGVGWRGVEGSGVGWEGWGWAGMRLGWDEAGRTKTVVDIPRLHTDLRSNTWVGECFKVLTGMLCLTLVKQTVR